MTMYADGQQQSWFQLSVWDVQGNTVIFQGYLGDEVWEALDINSMEEAEVQMWIVNPYLYRNYLDKMALR